MVDVHDKVQKSNLKIISFKIFGKIRNEKKNQVLKLRGCLINILRPIVVMLLLKNK